jgi:protein ImuB
MRSRSIRKESSAQLDAFRAPATLSKSRPELREPILGAVGESRELWLAVHLPQLPVDIQGGQTDERRSRKILERLATGAQRFTPRVSLAPPDGLLLEVKGSLKLFGGVESLRSAVEALHRSAGLEPVVALAPTPLAALARARANQTAVVMEPAHLTSQIASLALATLRWPEKVLQRLAKIGVYTIGQALRLPRAGFARRFGVAQLASLDRLMGRSADPQAQFHPRERFYRRRELIHEVEEQALILKKLEPLLAELERFLRLRQCGITWLECRLKHRHAPPTLCLLRLSSPAVDARRLSALLGEKLSALALPEPVRSCELRTSLIVPRALASGEIWQPGEHGGESGPDPGEFVEYLRARLGEESVYGLQLVADHRPEKQSASSPTLSRRMREGSRPSIPREAGEGWGGGIARRRPFWLLRTPRLLRECDKLRLSGTPERIEAGWWDGSDVTRDYYTALDMHGVRLWIFRERAAPHRWFLHGMFG